MHQNVKNAFYKANLTESIFQTRSKVPDRFLIHTTRNKRHNIFKNRRSDIAIRIYELPLIVHLSAVFESYLRFLPDPPISPLLQASLPSFVNIV